VVVIFNIEHDAKLAKIINVRQGIFEYDIELKIIINLILNEILWVWHKSTKKITDMILDKICWIWHQCLQNNQFDVISILTHESKKNHDWLFKNTNIDSYKLKEALLTIQIKKSSIDSYKSEEPRIQRNQDLMLKWNGLALIHIS
jgi:hypothetical protein